MFQKPVTPSGLTISPNGRHVALLYVRGTESYLGLFDAETGAAEERLLPCGRGGTASWSPDGEKLAFFAASRQAPKSDLFLLTLATGELVNLTGTTALHAYIPDWSPDGSRIAFSAFEVPRRADSPPHIFTVSPADGELVQRTNELAVDRTPKFSPDGKLVAFRRGNGEVWLLDLTSGATRQLAAAGSALLYADCFSTGGTEIVYEADSAILVVDVQTGRQREPALGIGHLRAPSWSPRGDVIAVVEDEVRIAALSPQGERLWQAAAAGKRIRADEGRPGPVWTRDGERLAFLDRDGNIWVADAETQARQITFFPSAEEPRFAPVEVHYPSSDGTEVPALLLTPTRPSAHPAAVIWLHGGPWGCCGRDDFASPYVQDLVSAGMAVLLVDYRGSGGHGPAWEALPYEERGVTDLADAAAAHGFLVAEGLAHPRRVGIAGYSYGGYLTLLALAQHPDRWACGVALWSVYDPAAVPSIFWPSLDAEPDLSRRNPVRVLDRMRSPLLILHGEQEGPCVATDLTAMRNQLAAQGVTCDLHLFADDTHGLNLHTEECCRLLTSFMQRYLRS